jgi:hypothetical protein
VLKQALLHEDEGRSGCIDPRLLDLGTSWRSSLHPGRLTPGERVAPVPIRQEAGQVPEPVWTMWKRDNSWLYRHPNSDPTVVQPVAIRHTDCVWNLCIFSTSYAVTFEARHLGKQPGYLLVNRSFNRRMLQNVQVVRVVSARWQEKCSCSMMSNLSDWLTFERGFDVSPIGRACLPPCSLCPTNQDSIFGWRLLGSRSTCRLWNVHVGSRNVNVRKAVFIATLRHGWLKEDVQPGDRNPETSSESRR